MNVTGFKSGTLLSIAKWFKYYNKITSKKKEGSVPTVLLVTMENDIAETVERLFNMTVSSDNIRDYTPTEVIKLLKEKGKMVLKTENDIDIVIKYFNDREIETWDLYGIIEDLEDDNREVIALLLDYIKRIRATESGMGDERIELKNVSNELKTLARKLDIPVITAQQVNRAGNATVDAAMAQNKEDLARFVSRSNVGSSWELIENSDWVCIINIEKKKGTDTYYLTFKRVKIRYKDISKFDYFNHPFKGGERIELIDDVNLPESLSELSLSTDFIGVQEAGNKKGRRNAVKREEENTDDDDGMLDLNQFLANKKSA